jgi:hypothetical protein
VPTTRPPASPRWNARPRNARVTAVKSATSQSGPVLNQVRQSTGSLNHLKQYWGRVSPSTRDVSAPLTAARSLSASPTARALMRVATSRPHMKESVAWARWAAPEAASKHFSWPHGRTARRRGTRALVVCPSVCFWHIQLIWLIFCEIGAYGECAPYDRTRIFARAWMAGILWQAAYRNDTGTACVQIGVLGWGLREWGGAFAACNCDAW